MDAPVNQEGSRFLDGVDPPGFDTDESPSMASLAQFEREQQIAFAAAHRDIAQRSTLFLEALAGRVAIAASCLAVGCPSALLPPEAWRAGGRAWAFNGKVAKVYEAVPLKEARAEWSRWYRFFTSGDLALRDCLLRAEIPRLIAGKSSLRAWHSRGGSVTFDDPGQLTAILLGIALEAEAYADGHSELFFGELGAQPVLSAGSFVRTKNRADPLCGHARLGKEFLPSLTRLRRWDPTGRRSRAAAMKHFVKNSP